MRVQAASGRDVGRGTGAATAVWDDANTGP